MDRLEMLVDWKEVNEPLRMSDKDRLMAFLVMIL